MSFIKIYYELSCLCAFAQQNILIISIMQKNNSIKHKVSFTNLDFPKKNKNEKNQQLEFN